MSAESHKASAPKQTRVYVVTISDTRTTADDASGKACVALLTAAGHIVAGHDLVKDDVASIRAILVRIAQEKLADVIVTSGGTGISTRDSTFEVVNALITKRLDGFGEIFRALSYAEIGSAAMLSRAVAGLFRGVIIFAMPGATSAVQLAMAKLIIPELGHLRFEAAR
jgi:molybdenum cofactor biosynthesis protein B